jgi:hypothetical protein
MTTPRLYVFSFGNGGYDQQRAVVQAHSAEEARRLLVADLRQQRRAHLFTNLHREGDNGLQASYHTVERLEEAEAAGQVVWEATGPVAYVWGVDG